MREHRDRKNSGAVRPHIDALIDGQYLAAWDANSKAEIAKAVEQVLDDGSV